MHQNPLLVVLGPTASGKTKLAVKLAGLLGAEIISADSRQIFKGMDIGTGKDLAEYRFNGQDIPYHLIDIKKAGERYNVNEFKEDFYRVFEQLSEKRILPILCGGTGLYIHSVLQPSDYTAIPVNEELRSLLLTLDINKLREILLNYPDKFTDHADLSSHKRLIRAIEVASFLEKNELPDKKRPIIKSLVIGLSPDLSLRRKNIHDRLHARLQNGMIEEVASLLAAGVDKDTLIFYGLEYKFITEYISKEISYEALVEKLSVAICQFAKRQMTFFRKMEKDGIKIHWFDSSMDPDLILKSAVDLYKSL